MSDGVTQGEFYEKIEKVMQAIAKLTVEMTETKTIIRDYNGLRQKFNDTDDAISQDLQETYKNEYGQFYEKVFNTHEMPIPTPVEPSTIPIGS